MAPSLQATQIHVTTEANPDDEDWINWETTGAGAGYGEIDESGFPQTAIHTMLMPGTTYWYRVRAENGTAPGGPWSNVSFKTTPIVAPGAPSLAGMGGDEQRRSSRARLGYRTQLHHDSVVGADNQRWLDDHQLPDLGRP